MKNTILASLSLVILAIGLWSFSSSSNSTQTKPSERIEKKTAEIEWLSIEEAMKRQKNDPKFIIIDIYTDWCGWCKKMDASTFKDEFVIEEINKNFYAVKLDAESKEDIEFEGKTYKFVESGRRGYHELAGALLQGKMSYPSFAYLSNETQYIQALAGFKSAQDIHMILQFFSSRSYKDSTWESFQTSYQSPYPGE